MRITSGTHDAVRSTLISILFLLRVFVRNLETRQTSPHTDLLQLIHVVVRASHIRMRKPEYDETHATYASDCAHT